MKKITILIHCEDQKGIIAAVTNYIASIDGNIVYLDQHVDADQNVFFMRLECNMMNESWSLDRSRNDFQINLANRFKMSWEMHTTDQKPRMALFVSKYDHCLYDIFRAL